MDHEHGILNLGVNVLVQYGLYSILHKYLIKKLFDAVFRAIFFSDENKVYTHHRD